MSVRFIVYSPDYDENSGGSIALHLLYARLKNIGIQALIWNSRRPIISMLNPVGQKSLLHYRLFHKLATHFDGVPIEYATQKDVPDSIIVYPEIVSGNPLRAQHVVRWLLNKPGVLTGETQFGKKDLFFYYMKAFDNLGINNFHDNELCLTSTHPAYVNYQRLDRKGSCCVIRKGLERKLSPPKDTLIIDGLSHIETAKVFNEKEKLICFDLYTRYAIYAALCGCIPIIVPLPGLSIEQWMPNAEDRYGIAYGEENIHWAVSTRPLLRERLARQKSREDALLQQFVERSVSYFARPGMGARAAE